MFSNLSFILGKVMNDQIMQTDLLSADGIRSLLQLHSRLGNIISFELY